MGKHIKSMPPLTGPCNLHVRGGVARVTSASSARMRVTRRSNSVRVALRRVRSGSGNCARVCWSASASAITRICLRLSGLSRSQSRRLELRFRPSHSSPLPAGRPVSGSATGVVFPVLVRIIKYTRYFPNASSFSPLICPFCSTRPVTRMARVSKTSPP
jgi:hypothetical protein